MVEKKSKPYPENTKEVSNGCRRTSAYSLMVSSPGRIATSWPARSSAKHLFHRVSLEHSNNRPTLAVIAHLAGRSLFPASASLVTKHQTRFFWKKSPFAEFAAAPPTIKKSPTGLATAFPDASLPEDMLKETRELEKVWEAWVVAQAWRCSCARLEAQLTRRRGRNKGRALVVAFVPRAGKQ
eukprot:3472620-Rhodomonas_salina.3